MVTAERTWDTSAEPRVQSRTAEGWLKVFNWLGLLSHGGWFLILPIVEHIPTEWRTWVLTTLALFLFAGHLYLWDLRRRRNQQ